MSQLRKVLLHKAINLPDVPTFFSGEHILEPELARELVNKGAIYVDDDDYNESIKRSPKIDPVTDEEVKPRPIKRTAKPQEPAVAPEPVAATTTPEESK